MTAETKTPERQAAEAIDRAATVDGIRFSITGQEAMEAISGAGLVVMTAERAAQMLDVEPRLRAAEEAGREVVRAHDSYMATIQDQVAAGNMRADPLGEAVEAVRAALEGRADA